MLLGSETPSETLRLGIRSCREGNWREGLTRLNLLAQREDRHGNLPGFFYGYLGQAIARCEGRKRVGLELCLHAVERDPFRPESYFNLASVYLIIGNRRAAIRALNSGLALAPEHPALLELQESIGTRRPPVLRFLSRDHLLNDWLGHVTWWLRTHHEAARLRREEKREERRLDLI